MASNKTSGSSSNSSDNDGSGSSASSPERKNPVSSVIHIPKAVPNPKYDEEDNTLSEADGKMAKHRRDRSRSHSSDRTRNRKRKSNSPRSQKSTNESKSKTANQANNQAKEMLTTKTGGAYIPPAKLKLMQRPELPVTAQLLKLRWKS